MSIFLYFRILMTLIILMVTYIEAHLTSLLLISRNNIISLASPQDVLDDDLILDPRVFLR
jgi:hypothetical protein